MNIIKITASSLAVLAAGVVIIHVAGVLPTSAQFNWGFGNGNIGQFNQGSVVTEQNTTSNTGVNQNSGGTQQTTTTGDATSTSTTNNTVNTNVYDCDCTPTPTIPGVTATPTPSIPGNTPTPTPGGNGGNGGNGGDGGDGGSSGSVGGASTSQGSILGLTSTSGENELLSLLKLLPAVLSVATGGLLLRKNG